MGAAWVLDCYVIPIIYGDLPYDKVGALQITKQIEKLNSESSLDNIVRTLEQRGIVKKVNYPLWSVAKKRFLKGIARIKSATPPYKKLTQAEFKKLEDSIAKSDETIEALMAKKSELESLVEDLQIEPNIKKRKEIVKSRSGKNALETTFREAVTEVVDSASKFPDIIQRIILSDYYDLPHPSTEGYEDAVDDAIRNGYLDPEDGLSVIRKKKNILSFHEALSTVDAFGNDRKICEWYAEEFGEQFDSTEQVFWDQHY